MIEDMTHEELVQLCYKQRDLNGLLMDSIEKWRRSEKIVRKQRDIYESMSNWSDDILIDAERREQLLKVQLKFWKQAYDAEWAAAHEPVPINDTYGPTGTPPLTRKRLRQSK